MQINSILSAEYNERSESAQRSAVFILWTAIISAIIGSVIGIVFGLIFLIRVINKGIRNLLENTATSINYILEGDFTSRIDPKRVSLPDFIPIFEKVNVLIDAFITPMTVSARHIAIIAKGAIPESITGDYKGGFKQFADNVNSLIDSMKKVTEVAENIAKGNLDIEVEPRSEEDAIMKSMQRSVKNLSEFATNVQSASNQVSAGSREMSDGSQRMAVSASQQAASIEEISSSIEEINASISSNAANSGETAVISEKVSMDAEVGGRAVMNTVEEMKCIAKNISVIE
jgi:methyl-accepting chemotaxis protein